MSKGYKPVSPLNVDKDKQADTFITFDKNQLMQNLVSFWGDILMSAV